MKFWDELFPEWELNQVVRGEWEITYTTNGHNPYKVDKVAIYEIFYSKKIKKYRVELSGYLPKEHSVYPKVIDWIKEQNNPECKSIKTDK